MIEEPGNRSNPDSVGTRLKRLRPATGGVDPKELFYQAGYRVCEARYANRPATRRREWGYRIAAGLLVGLCVAPASFRAGKSASVPTVAQAADVPGGNRPAVQDRAFIQDVADGTVIQESPAGGTGGDAAVTDSNRGRVAAETSGSSTQEAPLSQLPELFVRWLHPGTSETFSDAATPAASDWHSYAGFHRSMNRSPVKSGAWEDLAFASLTDRSPAISEPEFATTLEPSSLTVGDLHQLAAKWETAR